MADIKTITLNGTEQTVEIKGQNCSILNQSDTDMYASAKSGITAEADGVLTIPAGGSAILLDSSGSVSVLGTGKVQLVGTDYTTNLFRTSAQSGGSGADEVARAAISAHESNTDIHVTAEEKAAWNAVNYSNPNLLINPDFKINQRAVSGTITATGYFVDRWKLTSGSVTINSDGSITLNGTITQILENAIGTTFVASSSAGTASYDDSTATFTLKTTSSTKITWAKLEVGPVATQFAAPNSVTELVKCQRYYQRIATRLNGMYGMGLVCDPNLGRFSLALPTPLRIDSPSISIKNLMMYCGNSVRSNISSYSAYDYVPTNNVLTITLEGGNMVEGRAFTLLGTDTGYIEIDAEL